jgi:hypothetical protein
VISAEVQIFAIDLMKDCFYDNSFSSEFSLISKNKGEATGLVVWFDA